MQLCITFELLMSKLFTWIQNIYSLCWLYQPIQPRIKTNTDFECNILQLKKLNLLTGIEDLSIFQQNDITVNRTVKRNEHIIYEKRQKSLVHITKKTNY